MSENVSYIGSNDFEEAVLKSKIPVIVDFFSDDCPPCDVLVPIYENLAEKYRGHIKFVKIFRQENRELAQKLNVTGSPTVLFFKDGAEIGSRLNGFMTKPQVRLAIEDILGDVLPKLPPKEFSCDVLIMGAGPAGLTAAIYTARAGLHTIVLDIGVGGGQTAATYHIENYPGTPPGPMNGKDLTENMRKQALSFGAQIHNLKEIFETRLIGDTKFVVTEDAEYMAKTVIIATGAVPRALPAENADLFKGRGIHYCAICDGAMYQDREIVVIGGGNSALEEAVYLSKFASHITVIHRSQFRAAKIARENAFANEKIDIITNCVVKKVNGVDYALTSVELEDVSTGEITVFPTEGAFVYIGTEPSSQLFKDQLETDERGYIIASEDTRTNIPGVFAAGDIRTKLVRQVVTAAADGAVSGIMAEKFIASLSVCPTN